MAIKKRGDRPVASLPLRPPFNPHAMPGRSPDIASTRVFTGPTSLDLQRGEDWAWIGLASEDGLNRLRVDLLDALDLLFIELRWSGVRRLALSDAGWMKTWWPGFARTPGGEHEGRVPTSASSRAGGRASSRPVGAERAKGAGGPPRSWLDQGGNFCAGADLNEVCRLNACTAHAFARRGQRVLEHMLWPGWRSLTLISGAAMGGGCDLALSGQERWGVELPGRGALKLAHPAASLGILTGFGGTVRLVEILGSTGAGRLFQGLERWDISQAMEAGAIQRMLKPEEARGAVEGFLVP